VDRWLVATLAGPLRRAADPLVVDLGYGRHPVTTVELAGRLRRVRADVRVVGVEIDPERVAAAAPFTAAGLTFVHGGFELPVTGRPVLVRALNVLRQYDEAAAHGTWDLLRARLAPDGTLVEGTCDELGRHATWVRIAPEGPVSLTLAARLAGLDRPSRLAERLPKALIHRNVPGEGVHRLLAEMDLAWAAAAPWRDLGARQRWAAMAAALSRAGWPVLDSAPRWRQGELTVAWDSVAPGRAG
jgi:hypothetical protein